MKEFKAVFPKALIIFIIFTILCGGIYTIFITGISQLIFPKQANGSIIEVNGKKYGSVLLAQQYNDEKHLWGRIMNIDTNTFVDENGKKLAYSAPSNLSPASKEYEALVQERVDKIKENHPEQDEQAIPVDLVTCSGSGLDPHISVAAAKYQINRIAKNNNMEVKDVENIIDKYTSGKLFGVLGEKTVNVLEVNLAIDGILK
ncbi:potassium-transporting ATPase subunit C [Clostridium botulinum]|uniref:Potassium-transporting ATPase KdpC subunit n=2 Tax=Clostridium botulinum TaxID=1491 RepID=KDPC_CLOBA|nr:potassium-transporting ATPase subunit KdpC [Clostridium botulinum]B2V2P4.1 RecName: Full=Potassium-transporting ATPase KdpC subunit; AltName: Full=ATP phosphohydrolase [potassium-transporting] C chain; AltName: Full=Potassium-binding and translocating subunit C; AltName: Full=Potassium-translocating ATPase C chain [Clostridium botulinum E3 str. Alaska E43]ACD52932.1 K+-transporting ATPase, C subunit [Clostridium botulinum E3 str. Alaska E43]AJF28936.1 potassium-transporting ATPase subunit C [